MGGHDGEIGRLGRPAKQPGTGYHRERRRFGAPRSARMRRQQQAYPEFTGEAWKSVPRQASVGPFHEAQQIKAVAVETEFGAEKLHVLGRQRHGALAKRIRQEVR
jgi:hypothetical protein